MIDIIIYSKNRPLQLYSLLESLYEMTDAKTAASVSVIYRYDNEYVESLLEVRQAFSSAKFIEQDNFKNDTISCLKNTNNEYCTFLVDDIVFKENVLLSNLVHVLKSNPDALTFSMRLGLHLNFCYPLNSYQPIPNGNVINGMFVWDWCNATGDWSYPLSLDGHIFKKSSVYDWVSRINFNNPNQLEDRLQEIKSEISRYCICSAFSMIVNLPLNRVQNEYRNRNEDISSEQLLEIWKNNKKINIKKIFRLNNNAAHYPVALDLVERK